MKKNLKIKRKKYPLEIIAERMKKEHPIIWWWEGFKLRLQLILFDLGIIK